MRDLTLGMIMFEQAHRRQLIKAYEMLLREREYYLWNIPLWEELRICDPDEEPPLNTVITVKLDRHGKLMPANEASERAIDEWEKRYATKRYTFDPPNFH